MSVALVTVDEKVLDQFKIIEANMKSIEMQRAKLTDLDTGSILALNKLWDWCIKNYELPSKLEMSKNHETLNIDYASGKITLEVWK